MVEKAISLLAPGEQDIIEQAKAKKELKKEKKKLAEAKKELKADTIGSKVKKTFFSKPAKKVSPFKKQKIFGRRPVQEDFTPEQNIMRSLFGGGGKVMTNFDGRSLPRIDNTLNNPNAGGLIKSGDRNRETAAMFQGGSALPFFGGQRRGRI